MNRFSGFNGPDMLENTEPFMYLLDNLPFIHMSESDTTKEHCHGRDLNLDSSLHDWSSCVSQIAFWFGDEARCYYGHWTLNRWEYSGLTEHSGSLEVRELFRRPGWLEEVVEVVASFRLLLRDQDFQISLDDYDIQWFLENLGQLAGHIADMNAQSQ